MRISFGKGIKFRRTAAYPRFIAWVNENSSSCELAAGRIYIYIRWMGMVDVDLTTRSFRLQEEDDCIV